ncbi:phage tail assembly protein [Mycobacteroides chelonae]|uniref:phage tail assembly protein n=1 Tax=Mycobacteroides chelonae TaxID=1774 RepID=UPI0009A29D79|nr:phage tail assembly protein [Mycobacteroides chelonae]
MSNVFTLDSFREEVEREFAPFKLQITEDVTLTLRNLIRIPETKRKKAFSLIEEMQDVKASDSSDISDSGDSLDLAAAIGLQLIPLVADNESVANELVEAIRDDVPLIMKVLEGWMEATQVGEATSSES